ncbi:hypothetical protein ACF09L_03850 [Streptomyces sp. NPDC014779]
MTRLPCGVGVLTVRLAFPREGREHPCELAVEVPRARPEAG